ncbi:hypothetical protein [Rhizobium lusitanum]|uniref:Uncharacterized protein n=1 Tax=Rhizobium lusitanum TaxID=293958 RepID=A0A7X0IU71_9HYPH|nr:hypothetical protein [Rhizobium lusitanum]MBB6487115.1 hypothetical protein [Rhizobium lusitanum]
MGDVTRNVAPSSSSWLCCEHLVDALFVQRVKLLRWKGIDEGADRLVKIGAIQT